MRRVIIITFLLLISFTSAANAARKVQVHKSQTNLLTSGLVGYWSFNGADTNWTSATAGTTNDLSGNNNTGTLTNMSQSATPAIGISGQALNFDGGDDYVDMGDVTALNNASAFTITAWVKDTDFSDGNRLLFKRNGDNYDIMLGPWSNNNYYIEVGNDTNNTYLYLPSYSNYITQGEWYHLAMVFDGSLSGDTNRLKFFTDGVQRTLTVGNAGIPATTANLSGYPFQIAALRSGDSSQFKGLIDEVRVYNRSLSQSEITQLYNAGAARLQANSPITNNLTSGLVGSWTFNGQNMDWSQATAEARDTAGTNHGDVSGATAAVGRVGQALNFDGGNDYVRVPTAVSVANLSAYTITGWFKTTGLASERMIYDEENTGNGNPLLLVKINNGDAAGVFRAAQRGDAGSSAGVTATGNFGDNQWHYFVWVRYSASSFELFVDNVSKGTSSTNPGATTINLVTVGGNNAGTKMYPGLLDEVRVYDRALTADEVTELYNLGARKFRH